MQNVYKTFPYFDIAIFLLTLEKFSCYTIKKRKTALNGLRSRLVFIRFCFQFSLLSAFYQTYF